MPGMIIKHKVTDYDKWLAAYIAHEPMRKAAGEIKSVVWRDADDANNIVALIKFDTVEQARAFIASPELKEAMGAAGVVGPPEVVFFEKGTKYGAEGCAAN